MNNFIGLPEKIHGYIYCNDNPLSSIDGLTIFNLEICIHDYWYNKNIIPKIKENYFNKMLKSNPELIDIIKKDKSLELYYKKIVRKNKLKIFI